jgi:glycosyltransferase involved in cell wall biosynthesis
MLEQALALVPGSAEVVPPAIELGGVPDRAAARLALSVAPSQTLAVVVGRVVAGKRVGEALAAARLVPGLDTVVVGDGPELARLSRAFPDVRFVGRLARERALEWIAAADVLISASRDEGAPSAIREARALGVPVAARAAGDLEFWARTDPGLIVVA